MKIVLQPVVIAEGGVTIHMYTESPTRNKAFLGLLTFTKEEFVTFREVLVKGTSGKGAQAELIVHPLLHALEVP